MNRIPKIIITSDHWSQSTCIFFDDDIFKDFFQLEWAQDRLDDINEHAPESEHVTIENVLDEMEGEFYDENESVDGFDAEKGVCWSGKNYYSYSEDGAAQFAGYFNSLEEYINYFK